MRKQVKIGDVIEIPITNGFAYAQYTHQHHTYGGLIRVFDAIFENRPTRFSEIVTGPIRFSTFFPLRAAVKRGVFKVVSHEEIAPQNRAFPVFRNGIADPQTKEVSVWWFWDGEKEWRFGQISPAQRTMPILGIWNDTLLVERIEAGWTPQNDPS